VIEHPQGFFLQFNTVLGDLQLSIQALVLLMKMAVKTRVNTVNSAGHRHGFWPAITSPSVTARTK
jgi:hypothetical protein